MRSKYIFSILVILLFSSVFAQEETVGFEVNSQYRHLDAYKSTASVWSMTYRYNLPSDTRIAASLGLDNIKFFNDDDSWTDTYQLIPCGLIKPPQLVQIFSESDKESSQFMITSETKRGTSSLSGNSSEKHGGEKTEFLPGF